MGIDTMAGYGPLLDTIEARLGEIERRCAGVVEARAQARSDWPGVRLLGERIAEEDLAAMAGWARELVADTRGGYPVDVHKMKSLARALGIEGA
jgi:hypothetical protein